MQSNVENAVPGSTRLAPRLLTGLLLFGLWMLLSGKFDVFHLGVGILSVTAILWMHYRLTPLDSTPHPLLNPLRFVTYFFWLLAQMLISSIQVAKVVLGLGTKRPDPRLLSFRSEQPSLPQGVLLANSITLTPGTLTIDFQDGRYLIHALTEDTARDLLSGEMARRVARLGGAADGPLMEEISPEDWRMKR